jgi:hypothetical protein
MARRVTPATAFRADWPEPREGDVWVECGPERWKFWLRNSPKMTTTLPSLDGAPSWLFTVIRSYAKDTPALPPPAEFLPASAVGLLLALKLGSGLWYWHAPHAAWILSDHGMNLRSGDPLLFAAASSHWQQAALDGLCPGVEPSAFKAWLGGLDAS